MKSDRNNFAPRFGFAWRTGHGLVVRGGYGMYYSLEYQRAFQQMAIGPFVATQTFDNAIVNNAPLWTWPSIVPPGGSPNSLGTQDVNGANTNLPASYMQQWNLTIEKQIGANGIRLSYIGDTSTHLPIQRNLNQPYPSTTPFSQALRPYPQLRNIIYVDSGGTQNYQSLQIEFTRRLQHGLMIDSHYTWARTLRMRTTLTMWETLSRMRMTGVQSAATRSLHRVIAGLLI